MNNRLLHLFMVALLSVWLSPLAAASVGKVIIAKGETFAIDVASNSRPLKRRSDIMEGDTLITGHDSEIHIRFEDNAVLALRADSQLKISEYHAATSDGGGEQVLMELLTGGFRTITGTFGKSDKDAYQIRTPNASIGIRGTNYEALLNTGRLLVGVYQGGVRLENQSGTINLGIDSAFRFAEVGGVNQAIEGLVAPPEELKAPLANSLNAPSEPNDESDDEASANLQSDDEDLLIENLFAEEDNTSDDTGTTLSRFQEPTLTSAEPEDDTVTAMNTLSKNYNLADYADVRLTQDQIRALRDGTAKAGFVVSNDHTSGYRLSNYTLDWSGINTTNAVSFDISIGDYTYSVNLQSAYNPGSAGQFASDVEQSITEVFTVENQDVDIKPVIDLKQDANGDLVVNGYVTDAGQSITFDNFQGDAADVVAVLYGMGLCTNQTICADSFSDSALTIDQYSPATHFGYMVQGKDGPVFANWENESLKALDGGYRAPDNVLRGNSDANLVKLDAVDIREDGSNAIEWGYWDTSATNPAVLLKDASDLSQSEKIKSPFFFVTAPPAKDADLIGTKQFSIVTDAWHATTSTQSGMIDSANGNASLTASLDVNFETAEAVGTLGFSADDNSWDWSIDYYGKIKGAQFFSDYGYGSLTTDGGNTSLDAVGHVDGLFTEAVDSTLGFVGGFGLQTTDDNDSHHAQGVFVLK